jgi:hypothetical protein
VIGQNSKYEFVAITGTEYAIVVLRNAQRFRYLSNGLTPQEFGKVQRALSLRRSDKDPLNASLYFNTMCQIVKNEQWLTELFKRSSNQIIVDLTESFSTYDYNNSELFLESCRRRYDPSYFQQFCTLLTTILGYVVYISTSPFCLISIAIGIQSYSYMLTTYFTECIKTRFSGNVIKFSQKLRDIEYSSTFDKICLFIMNMHNFLLTALFVSFGIPIYSYSIVKAYRQLAHDAVVTVKEGASFIFATLLKETPQREVKALGSYIPVPISLPYNNISNFLSAQRVRQMKLSATADLPSMQKFVLRCEELFNNIDAFAVNVPLFKEWLDTRKWSIYKKLNCDRLFEGFCTHNTTRKSFLKAEVCLCDDQSAARVICANDNDIQATNGPMMAAVKKWLVEVSRSTRVIFTCGMDRNKLGKLISETQSRYAEPNYMSGDFSKFDSTVGAPLMEIERIVYSIVLPTHQNDVDDFIDRCQSDFKAIIATKGFKAGVAIPVSRGSGDPNTTVGNSLINYAFWMYIFDLLSNKHAMNQATAYVCGDDVHLCGSKGDLEQIRDFVINERILEKLGTVIKFTTITSVLSQSEYLSGIFMRAEVDVSRNIDGELSSYACEQIVHVAKPGRVLSKIMLTAKLWRNDDEFKVLRNSKLDALLTECWEFPLLCEKISNFLQTQNPNFIKRDLFKIGYSKRPRVCLNTEVDFIERYGVSLYDVDLYLSNNFKFDSVSQLDHPLMRALALADTGLDIIDTNYIYDQIDANSVQMDKFADMDNFIKNDISGHLIKL